jgi:hypothetical protein
MGQQLSFQLGLTETFAGVLVPVNNKLEEHDKLLGKATTSLRAFESLGDHLAIAKGFEGLFTNIRQSTMALEHHAAIAQGLTGFFGNLGEMNRQKQTAEAMVGLFGSIGKFTQANTEKTKRFAFEWGNFAQSFYGFRSEGGKVIFNLGEGLRAVIGLVARAVAAFARLGRAVVGVAAEEGDINLALRLTAGDAKAKEIQKLADTFAERTRFDDTIVKRSLLPFLDVGISDNKLLGDLAAAAADSSTRLGTGVQGFQEAMDVLGRIARKEAVSEKTLEPLGIAHPKFLAELAKQKGTDVESIKKLLEAGKVDRDTLFNVILDMIQKREGGSLGTNAIAGAGTLGGSLQRLSDLSGNVFKRLDGGPGLTAVQGVLDKFIQLMLGPAGDKFVQQIDHALKGIADVITPARLEGFITALGTVADVIGGGVELFVLYLGALKDFVISPLVDAGDFIGDLFGRATVTVIDWGDQLVTFFEKLPGRILGAVKGIASSIKDGLLDGVESAFSSVKVAGGQMGYSLLGGVRNALGIQSPSKVMAQLGGYTAEGFALGLDAGGARVESAARRALFDAVIPPGRQLAAGGGNVIQVTYAPQITIDGSKMDVEELRQALRRDQRAGLAQLLEELQFQLGAQGAESAG